MMHNQLEQENGKLLRALTLYKQNNLGQCQQIYQQLLQKYNSNPNHQSSNSGITNPASLQLRYTLICTISIIASNQGNYDYALELLQQNLGELDEIQDIYGPGGVSVLVRLRFLANLCFLQVLRGMFDEAISTFERLKELVLVNSMQDMSHTLKYVYMLFLRVQSLQQLQKQLQIPSNPSLLESFYLLTISLAKSLLPTPPPIEALLKSCKTSFIRHGKTQLAIVALRQLLLADSVSAESKSKYQQELGKLLAMDIGADGGGRAFCGGGYSGKFGERYEVENLEVYQCCKFIVKELIGFSKDISPIGKINQDNQTISILKDKDNSYSYSNWNDQASYCKDNSYSYMNNTNFNNSSIVRHKNNQTLSIQLMDPHQKLVQVQAPHLLWPLILKIIKKRMLSNSITQKHPTEHKNSILHTLQLMQKQASKILIQQMRKMQFYSNEERHVAKLLSGMSKVWGNGIGKGMKQAFRAIRESASQQGWGSGAARKMGRNRSQGVFKHQKQDKQNIIPQKLTRDRSSKSFIQRNPNNAQKKLINNQSCRMLVNNQSQKQLVLNTSSSKNLLLLNNNSRESNISSRTKLHIESSYEKNQQKNNKSQIFMKHDLHSRSMSQLQITIHTPPTHMRQPYRQSAQHLNAYKQNTQKNLNKMVKYCQYGSFLNKRNFNSDGGQYRFFRITQSVLKWAKNPQQIEQSRQIYPLKDITCIIYGKCTPTLIKSSNHLLKAEHCFSLKLQKRTLDFHCKDFEQAKNWVCGLGHKLKQINPNIRVYSAGRMLWKRMFALLKEKYTSKLRPYERNYCFQNSYAIILYGREFRQ